MTEFEKLLIRTFAFTAKQNAIIIQQNNNRNNAFASTLVALQVLVEMIDPKNAPAAQIKQTLEEYVESTRIDAEDVAKLQIELRSLAELIKSMGGDPLGLDNFKDRLN